MQCNMIWYKNCLSPHHAWQQYWLIQFEPSLTLMVLILRFFFFAAKRISPWWHLICPMHACQYISCTYVPLSPELMQSFQNDVYPSLSWYTHNISLFIFYRKKLNWLATLFNLGIQVQWMKQWWGSGFWPSFGSRALNLEQREIFNHRRSNDVLDLENQPGSGSITLTEDLWHQKYKNLPSFEVQSPGSELAKKGSSPLK